MRAYKQSLASFISLALISALLSIIQIAHAPEAKANDVISSGLYINIDSASFVSGSSVLTNLVTGKPNFKLRTGASGALTPTSINVAGQRNYFTTSATNGSAFVYLDSTTGITSGEFGSARNLSAFAWVYPTTANHVVLEEKGSQYGSANWYDTQIEMVGGRYRFSVWGCSSIESNSNSTITQNAWHYVGFTYDGTTMKSYVDGVEQSATNPSCNRSDPFSNGYNLYYGIGTNTGTDMNPNGVYYGGFNFGALHIYNRGLSAADVSANFTNRLSQSITLSSLGTSSKTYPYSQALTMSSTGSSGTGAITYAITAGGTATGCTLSSSASNATISASSSGTCLIAATIAADASYDSATSSSVAFTFSKATQTVTWSPTTAALVQQSPLTPSSLASALDSAGITYSVTSAGITGCSVNSSTGVLTYNAPGSCIVRASAAETSNYAAATRDVTFAITSISLQPTNDTTTAGLVDSFTITSSVAPAGLTRVIKWQVATDTVTAVASVAWADLTSGNGSGFTTETFTTSTLTAGMNKYRYRAIVTFTGSGATAGITSIETSTVATLMVNPAILITSDTSTITRKYGASGATRTLAFTGGTDTRTITATSLSLADGKITFNASTGLLTIDTRTAVGTWYDTITVTDAKGATASYVQTITITVADTLTVTSDTPTALTYTGAAAVFTDSVTVISGLVSGDVVLGATYNYTNIGGTTYGPVDIKPTNAGTYTITPSVLTFSSGAASNYAAITYRTSTLTINKAAQAALSVVSLYQPFFSNPTSTTLLVTGGSDTGTVSYAYVPSLSTAGGCALSGANNSTITVTSDGTCRIVATKAATANYLAAVSDTGTVTFHFYISNFGTPRAQEYPSEIVLVGGTDVVYQVETPPVISSGTPTTQSVNGTITLTGSGFTGTTSVKTKGVLLAFVVNSDTSLTFTIPEGLRGKSGRIAVENALGLSISDTLFTFI